MRSSAALICSKSASDICHRIIRKKVITKHLDLSFVKSQQRIELISQLRRIQATNFTYPKINSLGEMAKHTQIDLLTLPSLKIMPYYYMIYISDILVDSATNARVNEITWHELQQ